MIQKRDSRGMILFCVFNFVVALFGLAFGGVFSPAMVKASDVPVAVDLTIEQTLALYGTTLNGIWYSKSANLNYPITFHYGGNSLQWIPSDYTGNNQLYVAGSSGFGGSTGNPTVANMVSRPYLVYYAANTYNHNSGFGMSASDWGGNGKKWASYNGSAHTNLYLDFSISLEGITGVVQNIGYSGIMVYNSNLPTDDAQYSYAISNFSFNEQYRSNVLRYSRSGYNRSFSRILTPNYKKNYDSDIIDENREIALYFAHIEPSFDGTSFSYYGQQFNFDNVSAFNCSGMTGVVPDMGTESFYYTDNTEIVYLYIQCPTLLDYDWKPFPEPATGTGVTETLPPQYTVNLSNLETGVADLIRQEQNNNALLRVQISQLNTIIEQLNAIYARMAESGEVAINLTPAAAYPTLNSNIVSGINQDITTHTVAQLPDMGNGAQAFNTIGHELGLDTGIWLSLALFTVGFSIFCWVVFRGRG